MTFLQVIRNPHSTSQQLGDALRSYLLARKRPYKPLTGGDMLVIDQKGHMNMLTRSEWDAEVHRQDKRKKRCSNCHTKPCQCVTQAIDRKGQVDMFRENQMSKVQDSDLDWLDEFRRGEGEAYEWYDRPW